MRPRLARTSEESLTALAKSPVRLVRAVRKRLPKLCPLRPRPAGKAVLEELGEQRFVFGERDHAIADVARRQDVEFAAQASGAAAVVGDGDDGGDFNFSRLQGETFQAMQKRRETGSSSDCDDTKRFHFHI